MSDIRRALLESRWVFSSLFPETRRALVDGLAIRLGSREELERVPTCLLSSSFYLNSSHLPSAEIGGKPLKIFDIEVVDGDVKMARDLWRNAVTSLVGEKGSLGVVSAEEMVVLKGAVQEVSARLADFGPAFEFNKQIVIYDGTEWIASSQPHYLGAIFLNRSLLSTPALAETIVHELAHQELFCLNLVDRLVMPEADKKQVYAPFQKLARPPIGRLHSAHALFRVGQFLAPGEAFSETLKCLAETVMTFERGDLTELGTFLVEECYAPLFNQIERKLA